MYHEIVLGFWYFVVRIGNRLCSRVADGNVMFKWVPVERACLGRHCTSVSAASGFSRVSGGGFLFSDDERVALHYWHFPLSEAGSCFAT